MRVKELKIRQFKNLRDFEVQFDQASLTTVVLGQNGTGKSNLLEALVRIFRDLDLGELPSFEYEISYECRGRKIHIVAQAPEKKSPVNISADGESIPFSLFSKDKSRKFLPSNVFGYYSGPSGRFESHFAKHQERFYRQLLENNSGDTLRPLFYARLIHSQFVLLAFFYGENRRATSFLRDYLGIEGLESVLFVLNQPPWRSRKGDPRFWLAVGTVQRFLDQLFRYALAPLRLTQRVDIGLSKTVTQERLYLFLKDREALEKLRLHYETPADFFKALESTYLSKLLAEIRIKVQVRDCAGALTFTELSEGEQQLLTVLGLLRFTREDEALFLLDEPDTHLNPVWALHYLELLKEVVGEQKTSQIIMTTHDPLTIAGLTRNEVRVLVKDPKDCRTVAEVPEYDPKGMGVRGILTSDLFGLRSDLDLATLQLLDEQRDLANKADLTDIDKARLAELREKTSALDLSGRVSDPLISEVIKTLASNPDFLESRAPVLSREQQDRRRQIALEAIRVVKAEEEAAE